MRIRSFCLGLGVILVNGRVGAPSEAQLTPREVIDCSQCGLRLRPVIALGKEEGAGMVERLESRVMRHTDGRYVVLGSYSAGLVVFDSTGKHVGSVGRKGDGPGEFQFPYASVLHHDSLVIVDAGNQRVSVLSPQLDFVRSFPLTFQPTSEFLALPDGRFMAAAPIRTSERAGQPLHLIDAEGRIVRSFGSTDDLFRVDINQMDRRAIALAERGRIWVAHRNQYVIELWDTLANKVTELHRNVPWFPPQYRSRPLEEGPQPTITRISAIADTLFVLITVPDSDWRRSVVRPEGSFHGHVTDEDGYYDSIIEAIDVRTARLLGAARLDQRFSNFAAPALMTDGFIDPSGVPRLGVWKLVLSGS